MNYVGFSLIPVERAFANEYYKEIESRDMTLFLRFLRIFGSKIKNLEISFPYESYSARSYLKYYDADNIIGKYIGEFCTAVTHLRLFNVKYLGLEKKI